MFSDATTSDSIPHEFIDAEISVAGLETPADEQALNSALAELDGVESLRISPGKVAIEYDPLRVTKIKISEAIGKAGFRVVEVESGLASPISDALHTESDDS
jgi:copper chaperone CopZ